MVGAHLSGLPLNHELTQRGARLERVARTAARYRLFALPGTTPPKPGMVRDELRCRTSRSSWRSGACLPLRSGRSSQRFRRRWASAASRLEDGEWVQGFLCETWAVSRRRGHLALRWLARFPWSAELRRTGAFSFPAAALPIKAPAGAWNTRALPAAGSGKPRAARRILKRRFGGEYQGSSRSRKPDCSSAQRAQEDETPQPAPSRTRDGKRGTCFRPFAAPGTGMR